MGNDYFGFRTVLFGNVDHTEYYFERHGSVEDTPISIGIILWEDMSSEMVLFYQSGCVCFRFF